MVTPRLFQNPKCQLTISLYDSSLRSSEVDMMLGECLIFLLISSYFVYVCVFYFNPWDDERECWENQEFPSMKKKKEREKETCVGGNSLRRGHLKTRGGQKKRTQQQRNNILLK